MKKEEHISKRQVQWQTTHRKILESAGILFKQKGYRATSLAEIMQAAGLTIGGFYAHFETKMDLYHAALKNEFSLYEESLMELEGEQNQELSFMKHYLSKKHKDNLTEGCPILPMLHEMQQIPEKEKELLSNELIKEIKKRCSLFSTKNPEEALTIFCTLIGAMMLSRATKENSFSSEILAAATKQILKTYNL